MGKGSFHRLSDFHAGHFLQECLRRSGFNVEWLASKTDRNVAQIEALFAQPNLDAELFVKIGMPMGNSFFDPLHEIIFHPEDTKSQ